MIKNERGASLMEVIATMLIMSIVIGSGLLAFHAINGMMSSSSKQNNHSTDARETMHLMSLELTDATATVHPHAQELRYVRGNQSMKAFVHSGTSLTLYTFAGTEEQFENTSVRYNTQPHLYMNPRLITTKMKKPPVYTNGAKQHFTRLANGELLHIELGDFAQNMTLTIKLMKH